MPRKRVLESKGIRFIKTVAERIEPEEQKVYTQNGAFALMIPNVFYDFGKILLEKYFLWKMRHGYAQLP